MKKILLITAALVLGACSAKGLLKPDPEVTVKGTVSLQASMGQDHMWKGTDAVGVYGSKMGTNAKYVPVEASLGKSGTATLYGSAVDGEIVAYYPYSSKGMAALKDGYAILPAIQEYRPGAASALTSNAVAFARGVDGLLSLDYKVGVVHFKVAAKFIGEVKSVVLSSFYDILSGPMDIDDGTMSQEGEKSVCIRGIGKPEGAFDVWVVLPCGTYSSLEMTIVSDRDNIVKSVRGSIPVEDGKVAETILKDEAYEYAGSDYIVIRGEFD